jgi:hypothetical protein
MALLIYGALVLGAMGLTAWLVAYLGGKTVT